MPMSVTTAAKAIADGVRSEGARAYASAAHNSTVAADAQLPGPGRNQPIPKNVAMTVAHGGVRRELEGGTIMRSS
jgi:malic enzyme